VIELVTGAVADEKLGAYASYKIAKQYKIKPRTAKEMFGPFVAVGMFNDRFLGTVIWHHYVPEFRTIEVSIATEGPGWATRTCLKELFAYPFDQLRCQKVRAIIGKRNLPARKLLRGLGFKFEGNDRKGLGNDDAILYGLLRRECKWLTMRTSEARAPIAAESINGAIAYGQSQDTSSARPY